MSKSLDVYLDHSIVGQLAQNKSGQMLFTYHDNWLVNENAIPLSCSLSLRKQFFTQKECRGFFAGILPEEGNREIIARILGISARNDYAMLEQIGGECAGAVTFLPSGSTLPAPSYNYQSLDERELTRVLEQLPRQPLLAGTPGLRLSLAGAQNKIAVHIDENGQIALPLGGAPSTHILKPAVDRFPKLALNEVLCLELAAAIGIPAVEAKIGSVGNISYILVKRYDRLQDEKHQYPIRIHQEDFCQALAIPPEYKYQSEGGPSLKDCFKLIKTVSSLPAIDTHNLLKMVVFNIIIGNHDAHGKNFSLLLRHSNEGLNIRLAPAYDILSTVYYSELTSKMAMKIGKEYESDKLTLKDIERFAADIDLGLAAVRKNILEIAKKVRSTLGAMKQRYPDVLDLIALIDKRAEGLIKLADRVS
jgi:serine/threonine-protein kinase HipA